ncbi:hypothetical protein DRJ17_00990 [Candidatus Woesearchaeota archaeon]|nr:MAG: hypothetical protein DRJ17_00990 [Candidatus Woesearchaeota archaeon]
MTDEIIFPKNPFEDVNPSEFNKLNKKHVTEDFVEENLKRLGWEVFRPFNDTGIDRIIMKRVCPNGHTKVDEQLHGDACPICNAQVIEIRRFIQVKTRQLKNNIFGFTLKSKDIRVDPRHVYLLYSDNTSNDKQDFLIISVKDYLKFFDDNHMNPFAPTSFRKGNNKLNSLRYNPNTDKWSWGRHDWEMFRNLEGMKRIQDPNIDLNLDNEIIETRALANKLQRVFAKGSTYSKETERKINQVLQQNLSLYSDPKKIVQLRKSVEEYIKQNTDEVTFASMKKYFEFIKTIEVSGADEDSKESKELIKEMSENE